MLQDALLHEWLDVLAERARGDGFAGEPLYALDLPRLEPGSVIARRLALLRSARAAHVQAAHAGVARARPRAAHMHPATRECNDGAACSWCACGSCCAATYGSNG